MRKEKFLKRCQKNFEKCGSRYFDNEDYLACITKLDQIYVKKVVGLRIRSKYEWYEKGEKSTKFFLNLEKRHIIQTKLKV